jgi:uncharacterized protein
MRNNFFVIETNTLIISSLFRNSVPRKAERKANQTGKVLASSSTYNEFFEVFLRSKFDKYISRETRLEVLFEFKRLALFIGISERITACRDPKDDKFLELAVSDNASCIITGDKDLLILNPFRGIPILNAVDFINNF